MPNLSSRWLVLALIGLAAIGCLNPKDEAPKYEYGEAAPAEEAEVVSTAPQPRRPGTAFDNLDTDGDGGVSLAEYIASRGSREGLEKGRYVFAILDRNGDGKLSLPEFKNRPPAANFREIDRDADGGVSLQEFDQKSQEALFLKRDADGDDKLSLEEFSAWLRTPEQRAGGEKAFQQKDADGDGLLDFRESAYAPVDADFWALDRDGDFRVSLAEVTPASTPQPGEEAASGPTGPWAELFASIDLNHDGGMSLDESKRQPDESRFQRLDVNQDGQVPLDQFKALATTPEEIAKAEATFQSKDANGDGQLTLEEHTRRDD